MASNESSALTQSAEVTLEEETEIANSGSDLLTNDSSPLIEISPAPESESSLPPTARSDDVDPALFLFSSHPALEFSLASPSSYTMTATNNQKNQIYSTETENPEESARSQLNDDDDNINNAADNSAIDEELYTLPPSHPLLTEANAQLSASLKEKDVEVSSLLREKLHALNSLESRRTDLGVELYSAQQELAKQQIALEKQQIEFQRANQERLKKESELSEMIQKQSMAQKKSEETEKRREKIRSELDELRSLKKRISQYEENVNDEITVAKAVTSYTETMISSAEKAKNAQDSAIAEVSEKINSCQSELEIIEKQIENQIKENSSGDSIIKELQKELELVAIEQKEFRARWKIILAATQAKQDAIGMAIKEIEKVKEELRALNLLHAGTKHSIKRSQEEHAKLSEFNSRLDGEFNYLAQQTELIVDLSSKYLTQFDFIASSLTKVEDDLRRQNAINQRLDSEIAALTNEVDNINRKRMELEEEKAAKIDAELTIEKGSEQIYRSLRKSKRASDLLSNDLAEVENEIARVSIDLVNTNQQCQKLEGTKKEYEKEIIEKDLLIEKYDEEQLKRHELIAKKQLTVTKINKELEKIIEANAQSEFDPAKSGGHLDIQIRRIKRNRDELIKEKEEQQREWIKAQARVVAAHTENAEIELEMKQLQAKQIILQHQSKRLANEIFQVTRDKSELDSSIRSMANGGQKMNGWIADLTLEAEKLEDKNRSRQQEFIAELKEKQVEANEFELFINNSNTEVETIKSELISNEFAIFQWKQKIAVEIETQELLNPNVGMEEIAMLKKDNSALEISIVEANKSLTLAKNEMAAKVKATIDARCIVKPINTKQKINAQKANLKQQIDQTKRQTKNKKTEFASLKETIKEIDRELEFIQNELHRQQLVFNEADRCEAELNYQLELRAIELRIVKEQTIKAQKRGQKTEEKIKLATRLAATPGQQAASMSVAVDSDRATTTEKLAAELARNDEQFTRLVHLVTQMSAEQPRHREWAQRLLTFV